MEKKKMLEMQQDESTLGSYITGERSGGLREFHGVSEWIQREGSGGGG
jgi:hypothetical protein